MVRPVIPHVLMYLVLGRSLRFFSPGVGFHRLGYCNFSSQDPNPHTVAAIVSKEFLEFSRLRGNDLITPRVEHGFWGLTDGCRWCLGIHRWLEAFKAKDVLGDTVVPRSFAR
jgi:uncharacterized protein